MPELPNSDDVDDEPPDHDAAIATATAFASLVMAIVVMIGLHYIVARLPRDARPAAFLAVAFLYFIWPLIALMPPRPYLVGVVVFPLFGVWLGMSYTGDMGRESYMFAAQPPCFAGLIGVVGSAWISIHRVIKGW